MTTQHHMFKTLISEAHSLHAQSNGKIQLVVEVDASDRKVALEAFSRPGTALAIVRLPSIFDRGHDQECFDTEDQEDRGDETIVH